MRLFCAIEVPSLLKESMQELVNGLPNEGLKKVNPSLMHITLKFLGEVEESQIPEVEAALSSVDFSPFSVQIRGVGVFPNPKYVKAVWAGVEGGGLGELAQKVEDALSPLFPKEKREFSGHITLARVRHKIEISSFLEKHSDELFGGFVVNKFVLMQSVLTQPEPEYISIGEFESKSGEEREGKGRR